MWMSASAMCPSLIQCSKNNKSTGKCLGKYVNLFYRQCFSLNFHYIKINVTLRAISHNNVQ